MKKHHQYLLEVPHHCFVNGIVVISQRMPHFGEGNGDQMNNWNSWDKGEGGIEVGVTRGSKLRENVQ